VNVIKMPRKKNSGFLKCETKYIATGIGMIKATINTINIHFLYGVKIPARFSILLIIVIDQTIYICNYLSQRIHLGLI